MLTADLVNARRRGKELRLVALDGEARDRAGALAARILETVRDHVGHSREELTSAIGVIDAEAREQRLKAGLVKLALDRCSFDAREDIDPEELRREVFSRASEVRAALEPGAHFDRSVVLAEIAQARGVSPEVIDGALFSDLRAAHTLLSFDALSPSALLTAYEYGQAQAVLLRAVKVQVDVRCASPAVMRAFFRKLKFLRLLHSIEKEGDGHRITIDGPFSLFESVTKYGLQLALVLPLLQDVDAWKLTADIRWGKQRLPLTFHLEGGFAREPGAAESPGLPTEIESLMRSFSALDTGWQVSPNEAILELPGAGLSVPDLVFERTRGKRREKVYLEVMGYWSRAAVWQRVELVKAGLAERVLFAVSSRLRVSEEVLGDDLPSALYVYKGAMSARAIAERLELLAS